MNENNNIESVDHTSATKEFALKKFEGVGLKNHFPEVLKILQDEFKVTDPELLSATILHDTLEDTDTTYDELAQTFSKDVADLVEEVSHPKNYNHEQRLQFYEKLKSISPRAKMIKLADFTSHLRSFIKIYKAGKQNLHPKFVNNDKYIAQIRDFLNTCPKSGATELVYGLTNELETYL
jgi:(p)ppGpp synthase/HD superfamily hydrolase